MKTLGEILTATVGFLKEKGCTCARRTAEELIGHTLQFKRIDLYMQFDRPMAEFELEVLRGYLKRALKQEPVEYITGEILFYHCCITVGPDVLIPRQETEILVDMACKQIQLQDLSGKTAWDLCTGSGCIGIAVKKTCPQLEMTLSDISLKALAIAQANARRNGVHVEIIKGDFLTPFAGRKADFVFCNPPYVTLSEYVSLERAVKDFEPRQALVGGEDGLDFYRQLKGSLPACLNPKAKVFLELGAGQGNALLDLFSGPEWKSVKLEKDWAGHDRFFFLEFE
jgi:release factor glutamine methyltransferase